jgi:hypothetical protein
MKTLRDVTNSSHVKILSIDEKINKTLFDEYFKLFKGRKRLPRGGKKKGGKGKGKGKGNK